MVYVRLMGSSMSGTTPVCISDGVASCVLNGSFMWSIYQCQHFPRGDYYISCADRFEIPEMFGYLIYKVNTNTKIRNTLGSQNLSDVIHLYLCGNEFWE